MAVAKVQKDQNASSQSRFASSKLIQNLGSNPIQYLFSQTLRTVHGRD